MNINIFFIAAIFLIILLFPVKTFAYLDMGTGSYIIQVIAAAILGGFVAAKIYWGKLKVFLINLFRKKNKNEKRN